MPAAAPLVAVPLRLAVLSGALGRPGGQAAARMLCRFLTKATGALSLWFGVDAAERLRADPDLLRGMVDRDIVRLDTVIAAQLEAVLHHPRLQRLEGSWRGLAWMLSGFAGAPRLKARIMSATWDEVDRDVSRAGSFDRSSLFRLIYENEFGHAGGEPFGLLLIDHEVGHRPEGRVAGAARPVDDVAVLQELSGIAAAAFLPMVVAAAPALLGVDGFEALALSQDVAAVMAEDDHARWRNLTEREDARFLCVVLPRVLARPRWSGLARRDGDLWFEEHAPGVRERVWFSAGYAFAAIVARAQARHEWPADIRGIATDRIGGGLVLDLPTEDFVLGSATSWPRASIELALTDRQESDLVAAGLMPLNTLPFGDAGFASVHSLQASTSEGSGRGPTAAQTNRRLSAQINSMLCVSRIAHYVKIIGRELTGSFVLAADIERRLQAWLSGYTNASQNTDADSRARHPLLSSRVSVHEHPGRPGSFGCVIHLQPYYQIDDVATSFRFITGFTAAGDAS